MKVITYKKQQLFLNGLLNQFLGIVEIPKDAQYFIRNFVILSAIAGFVSLLSSTFWILFIIEKINFAQASFVISFTLFIQMLFDYPSGSLADWIGQRWVLFFTYICWGIGLVLMIFATSFPMFLLIGAINGMGSAQFSGTLDTWLENNYQKTIGKNDPERKIYGFSRQRFLTINRITSALSYMVGGFLASTISREFVFLVQGIAMGFLVIFILMIVKNYKEEKIVELSRSENTKKNKSYLSYLKCGIHITLSSKAIFCLIMAISFFFAAFSIWGRLLLLPVYFGYTGSDEFAATLRTIIYVNGIWISLITAKFNNRIRNEKVSIITLLLIIGFFPGYILLTSLIPPENKLNIVACLIVIVLMNGLIPTFADLVTVLRQRIMIDLIPTESRNSIYSLQPTIAAIIGIILLPITGYLVQNYGITAGIGVAALPGFIAIIFTFLTIRSLNDTNPQPINSVDS